MLVFRNTDRNYLLPTYAALALSTVMASVNAALVFSGNVPENIIGIGSDMPMTFAAFCLIFSAALFAVSRLLLLHTFLRIQYNESTRQFIATAYNWHLARQHVTFKPGGMHMLHENPSSVQHLLGNYVVDGKRYYLPLKGFKSTQHYNLMLGHLK